LGQSLALSKDFGFSSQQGQSNLGHHPALLLVLGDIVLNEL